MSDLEPRLVVGGRGACCYVELASDPLQWIAEKAAVPPPPPFQAAILEGSYDPARILSWATDCLKPHEAAPGIYLRQTLDALGHLRLENGQHWQHIVA